MKVRILITVACIAFIAAMSFARGGEEDVIGAVAKGSAAGPAATGTEETLTGVVSDAACGAKHSMKNMSDADCTRFCVKAGVKYALVVGPDIYTLQRHEADLAKLAGVSATVRGSLTGKTITVESVMAAAKR